MEIGLLLPILRAEGGGLLSMTSVEIVLFSSPLKKGWGAR